MKKQIKKTGALITALLLCVQLVSAQRADTSASRHENLLYDRYMHRHKTFKTVGWVFLASGGALAAVGLGYLASPDAYTPGSGGFFSKADIGGFFIAGGALVAMPSVPFLILAGSNAKKAKIAKLQLTTGDIPAPRKFNYLGIALKVNL